MKRALFAYPNRSVLDAVDKRFLSVFDGEVDVVRSYTCSEALARIAKAAPDVLVVKLAIADGEDDTVSKTGGLEFVERLRRFDQRFPIIILAPCALTNDETLLERLQVAVVVEGDEMMERLIRAVRDALASDGDATGAPRSAEPIRIHAFSEVSVKADGTCIYQSECLSRKLNHHRRVPFKIELKDLNELLDLSLGLEKADDFDKANKALGKRLFDTLMKDGDIREDLGFLSAKLQEVQRANAPLRFVVESPIQPLAVESIFHQHDDHWLSRAAIVRRLEGTGSNAYPLFEDTETRDKPINVLVLDADCEGTARIVTRESKDGTDTEELQLSRVGSVVDEADWLERLLTDLSPKEVGVIGRMRRDPKTGELAFFMLDASRERRVTVSRGSFADLLRDTLRGEFDWHIVHFAGHSLYEPKRRCGYVFLPGIDSKIEVVRASSLAGWMGYRTRFAYMSSCEGSSEPFIMDFCKANVPAVTGFRHPVASHHAQQHAQAFYEALFRHRSLEEAFFSSCSRLRETHELTRAWMWPQMIRQ